MAYITPAAPLRSLNGSADQVLLSVNMCSVGVFIPSHYQTYSLSLSIHCLPVLHLLVELSCTHAQLEQGVSVAPSVAVLRSVFSVRVHGPRRLGRAASDSGHGGVICHQPLCLFLLPVAGGSAQRAGEQRKNHR